MRTGLSLLSALVVSMSCMISWAPSALAAPAALKDDVRLQGAGATFPNPLYQRWVSEFQKSNPTIKIDYQSVGSGGGIKAITEKTVHFAGSDAPLSKKEIEALGGAANIVQVPSTAGAVVPAYNLPEVKETLKFSGEVLAEIYQGRISKWNDPKLAELNPGVALPDVGITPAWRSDGSGTTFVFTSYLATQSESYKSTIGSGKQVSWPVGQGGKGNEGVAAAVQSTKGALGYIELNYALANKITFGEVKNKNGKFVKATPESISAAGEGAVEVLKGNVLAANIWNQPGDKSYPISGFSYIIFFNDLGNAKTAEEAKAFVNFVQWCMTEGQDLAGTMDYAPLSSGVRAKVAEAIKGVNFKGEALVK